jgi:hypothetical protein
MKNMLILTALLSFSAVASDKLNFEEPVTLKKTEFDIKKIYSNFLQIYQALWIPKPAPTKHKIKTI